MTVAPIILAVDLGASSGRVLGFEISAEQIQMHEVHRFANFGVKLGNHLMWNLPGLWQEVLNGLTTAANKFQGRQIKSVGVDTWGVDFAFLSHTDELLNLPFHYRDSQNDGMVEAAFETVPRMEIYEATGLQFMQINSLYQMLAIQKRNPNYFDNVKSFLMMPDVFHWLLSGQVSNERTDVSTSQMYDPRAGDWARTLLEKFSIPQGIFGPMTQPGTNLGTMRSSVLSETGLPATTNVVLPGSHDTASAVVAIPKTQSVTSSNPDWCYISSGTWSLMGVEIGSPIITQRSAELNFTNEAGVEGTTRLLKNIAGLWIIQECRRIWQRDGRDYSWEQMAEMAASIAPLQFLVNPDDSQFIAPEHMPATLQKIASKFGRAPQTDAEVLRCAFDSLAMRYAQVHAMLEELLGNPIQTVYIVGGGVQNQLLCQLTADACGREVLTGPAEATAIGNALIQATHCGIVENVSQARTLLASLFPPKSYQPKNHEAWRQQRQEFGSMG